MNKDYIIIAAQQFDGELYIKASDHNRAVKAAVAAEREACIKDILWHVPRSGRDTPEYERATKMVERIRARGQQ